MAERAADRRRRVLRGLGASPILMTVVSRPVLGHSRCAPPSSFESMPLSHETAPGCAGRTPVYWRDPRRLDQWPEPYRAEGQRATRFDAVFALSPYPGHTTLLRVLTMDDGPTDEVASHVVATVLNVAKGWVQVLSVPGLQALWRRYMRTGGGTAGYFEPSPGGKWFHDDILVYLRSTMPL